MGSVPTLSTSQETANAQYAARVVHMLLASFPQQEPKDPDTYGRQLIDLCTGYPCNVLRQMVNPTIGLLATARFLPTIAEVNDFLNDHTHWGGSGAETRPWREIAKQREEEIAAEESASPEERAACVKRALAASEAIRKAARGITLPAWDAEPAPTQTREQEQESLDRLMQTDLMRGFAKT